MSYSGWNKFLFWPHRCLKHLQLLQVRFYFFITERQGKRICFFLDILLMYNLFRGLVIQNSATKDTSRQQEIEVACLSIKYYCGTFKWWNTYTALLWSMRTNQPWKSAQNWTLSSVMMSDTNWSPKERCTTDMSTISARGPVIFLFQTRSFKESKKKGDSSKTSEFFLNKLYHLTSGFQNNNNKDFI